MKTTVKINLSGQIFELDDDAYQALKDYLDSISKRFRNMEEGAEIISDIESRIAELFQSKISDKKEVITIEDVNDVIAIMGQPEDFLKEEGPTHSQIFFHSGKFARRLANGPFIEDLGVDLFEQRIAGRLDSLPLRI